MVDISNTSGYYSLYEWNKLSSATKFKLICNKNRNASKEKKSTGDKEISMYVSSSSVTTTDKYDKVRSATINALVKALQFSSPFSY